MTCSEYQNSRVWLILTFLNDFLFSFLSNCHKCQIRFALKKILNSFLIKDFSNIYLIEKYLNVSFVYFYFFIIYLFFFFGCLYEIGRCRHHVAFYELL